MSSKKQTTGTKEDGKPVLTPKLRFPEFRGAEGWKQTALGSVARLKNGYAFKSADYVDSGPFQIITIANVQQGSLALDSIKRIAQPPSDIQSHQKLDIGDILISMTGNVGRVCRVTCNSLLLNQRVGKLIPEEIVPEFFYHSLQRDEFRNAMQLKAAGGAQGNLSSGDITDYTLHRPADEAEQQKIAECLSSVDEVIAAQARKVDALKTHKKGLMQQLFPREGETQPRFRFPEFNDEWNDATLGELSFSVSSGKDARESDGPFDLYGSTGVIGKTATASYDTPHILVARVGANAGHLTKASGQFGVTDNTLVIRLKQAASIDFVFHFLGNININKLIFGSGQPLITGSILKAQRVLIPAMAEQSKISTCLSSIDDLINAESDKLEALKAHKNGLMQQLFPSAEAVNG